MLFHKPVSWILLNWLNSLCWGWWWSAGAWIPFLELALAHPAIPIAASTCRSEGVFKPWAAAFKALWNKSCISGSLKHLTDLPALCRRQDFARVAILCRIVPRLVPAALRTTIASAEGTDKGSAVTATWHGDNCLEHLGDFLKGDQKTVAALGDRLRSMSCLRAFSCQKTNLPLRFLPCFSAYLITGGKCVMLPKMSFPWSNVCFISHVNASMTLSLLQRIKHLGNVSLNSRSVLWNPSTWE